MTSVVMAANVPSTGVVPGAAALRLPFGKPPDGVTREQFFDTIAAIHERDQAVVCVYPSWNARAAEHNIRLVRSLLNTERVVGVKSHLPPLALSLTVDLLVHLAQYVPPGIVIEMVNRLSRQLTSGARLSSVTKFQHAPTSLAEHMRSYLPKSAFVAVIAPEKSVHRAGSGSIVSWRPPDPVHLVVATDEDRENWVRQKLVPELRPAVVRTLPSHPIAERYWGSKQSTEFVAFSAHPDALTTAVRHIRYRPCAWCGELVSSDPCPFCQMTAQGATFQPSHTLPENQQLPSAPLVGANGGSRPTTETHPRSETR